MSQGAGTVEAKVLKGVSSLTKEGGGTEEQKNIVISDAVTINNEDALNQELCNFVPRDPLKKDALHKQVEKILLSGSLTSEEMKIWESELRSLFARAKRTGENAKSAKFTVLRTIRKDSSVYRLCQNKSGRYWYKDRGKYVCKDTPEERERHGLPSITINIEDHLTL